MSDKVDLSLDDIIKQSGDKFTYRGRGGFRGRGASYRGSSRGYYRPYTFRGAYRGATNRPYQAQAFGVDFNSWAPSRGRYNNPIGRLHISNLDYNVTNADIRELFSEFGTLIKSTVHYDPSGRSQGTAEVIFEHQSQAQKALSQYNNVPLDGRPMKILLMGASSTPSQAPSSNFRGSSRGSSFVDRRGGRGAPRPAVTATREELDAELDAYRLEVN